MDKETDVVGADHANELAIHRAVERYLADPAAVSLEDQRAVYHHFLSRLEPKSGEAEQIRLALGSIDAALERARQGDPAFVVTVSGTRRRGDPELRHVRPEDLRPDPANSALFRNIEGEDFEQLKDSIQEMGVIEPVIADREFRVICGHQRLRAARAVGLASVPVVIREVADDQARAVMAIEENIRRRQLQPSEVARAVKKLAELRQTKEATREIAKEIGLSERQVSRYRTLADLIPDLSAVLDAGQLPQSAAVQIAQLDADVQRALYAALGERIAHALDEQKAIEFKKAHAALLEEVKDLTSATKSLEQRKHELETTLADWKSRLERAEFTVGDEIKARKVLEEELEKVRAEMYRKVQDKQALIDKLTDNIEPAVPPDYQALKSENVKLKAALKERGESTAKPASQADALLVELDALIASRLSALDLDALTRNISSPAKERLQTLIRKLEAWIASVKQRLGSPRIVSKKS